jgi:K+-sensing histidine kinase KdpD
METKHAPAGRSSYASLITSNLSLEKITYLNDIFCSLSFIFCILDENRQIVFTNDILMKTLQVDDVSQILGKRFGEAINCRFAFQEEGGCGTTEHCRYCGAVNAILKCQETGTKTTSECRVRRIIRGTENFLDIEVTATPFSHDNRHYTIFSLVDITDRKRRAVIEKIFFHDIMNVAAGLQGFFELFHSIDEEEQQDFIRLGASLSQQIIDEIECQRLLVQAESQELVPKIQAVDSLEIVGKVTGDLQFLSVAKEKILAVNTRAARIRFNTDPVLLQRVLNNMVKNALEASKSGETVTLDVQQKENQVTFSVHNPALIPHDIEMQIFMRSFSTKGTQRGVGTYSMKILGEQYLGGKVDFTTSESSGTRFFITLDINKQNTAGE